MSDREKTKAQLIEDLEQLRERIAEFETDRAEPPGVNGRLEESEQKRATAAMEKDAAKYQGLVDNLSEAVLEYDREARILFASSQIFNIIGREPEELVGRSGFDFVHPDDLEDIQESLREALQLGHTYRSEYRICHKDGHYVSVGGAGRVVGEGAEVRIIGTVQDISERIKAEQLLKESHRDLEERVKQRTAELETVNDALRQEVAERKRSEENVVREQELLRKLFDLQDRERKLLSHEIHDGFVQDVVGAKMLLESAAARLAPEAAKAPGEIDDARTLLAKSLSEARRMITELRPMIIDEGGIVESIDYLLAEEDGKHHLRAEFHHDVHFHRLDPILEGTVFRIVQEALNNVKRHSKSQSVEIRLAQSDDLLRLEIRDEGVGFDPAAVPADRFGLRGIRERARLFGGQAAIRSEPGKGTQVVIDLPLPAGDSAAQPKAHP